MEEDGIQLPIIAVNLVTAKIPYSSNELDNICEETREDPTLVQDGLVNVRDFHKNSIYIGTSEKIWRVLDFSYLPH